jgi:anti-sigma B factor antagonist
MTETDGGSGAALQWHVFDEDTQSRIVLKGELDLAARRALEDELVEALHYDGEILVVDLHDLTFIDSTGLSLLIRVRQERHQLGRRLLLHGMQARVFRVFEAAGVTRTFEYVEDVIG